MGKPKPKPKPKVKTAAPSGITIGREDVILTNEKKVKFNTEWKIADADYGDGQQYIYNLGLASSYTVGTTPTVTTVQKEDKNPDIGKTAYTKTTELNLLNYYPNKQSTYLIYFEVSIRGNRKTYKKKKKKINPDWSDYATKRYTLLVPPEPIVTQQLSSEHSNITEFNWTLDNIEKPEQLFYDFEWEAILVKDANISDGSSAPGWDKPDKKGTSLAGSQSGSTDIEEDSSLFNTPNYSYTRFIRVRSRGPAGFSKWKYARHVYTRSARANNATASATRVSDTGGYLVTSEWSADSRADKPIDKVTVQYTVTQPNVTYRDETVNNVTTRRFTLSCPTEASWDDANTLSDTSGKDALIFETSNAIGADELMYIRVNTEHDKQTTFGKPALAGDGKLPRGILADPTGLTVNANPSTHRVTITATNQSALANSFLAVYYRDDVNQNVNRIIGIIPHGTTSATIQAPDWGTKAASFGVQAVIGDYTPLQPKASGVTDYTITNRQMESSYILWDGGSVPLPPSNVKLSSPSIGTITVRWDWTWTDATSAELSWSDRRDAWESTSEPSTYVINNTHAGQWNIVGLSVGTYYVRVRLIRSTEEGETYGTYSGIEEIKLSSAPDIPTLTLSPTVITEEGSTTGYWAFTSNDGTAQSQAEICEAMVNSEGAVTYGKAFAKTATAQSLKINAKDQGWKAGEVHNLCVRVTSASNETSAGWSNYVPLTIAEKVTSTITSTSLVNGVLTDMPMTVNVAGAGVGGTTTVIIERADNYHIRRPDENDIDGFANETIAIVSRSGEGVISIDNGDLIGTLDDGAPYRILAQVKDTYGQVAEASMDFTVRWAHQALIPSAIFDLTSDEFVAFITPVAPTGYVEGDTCDIYRLSVDKPELIVKGAQFGTKYVDPYPALGEFGGHRIVYRTKNGDYITADNHIAWADYGEDEDDTIDNFATIIDFGKSQIYLPYDLNVSNSWTKDFTETHYLGGSIQGDWKPGVSRKSSVKSTIIIEEDPETVEAIRRLAEWTGICHIRTPEGSSFACDIQVNEDREEKWVNKLSKVSFSITRVESEGFDGLTYDDWYTEEQEEE